MAADTEDAEAAASRLEAALERIARAAATGAVGAVGQGAGSEQVAMRLDGLIGRLRAELGNPP